MAHDRHLWIWYTPFGLGGVETYLLGMMRHSRESGIEVGIASTSEDEGPLGDEYRRLGVRHFAWSSFQSAYMGSESSEGVRQTLIRDFAEIRPTLLMLNDCVDFGIGTAPLLRRLRPYCTIVDTFHIDGPDDGYLERRRPYVDLLDGVIGTNRRILEKFEKHFGRRAKGVATRYVVNGVDVEGREREAGPGRLRIAFVGRLAQEQKRILEIPAVLAKLRELGVDFTFTVAGEGPERGAFEDRVRELGLGNHVTMLGFVEHGEISSLLQRHDVFLNLSDYEGFSMSLIEAMACGCVPVISDLPSLDREILRDGENCRLVPTDEPGRAVGVLAELSPESLAELSERALKTGRSLTTNRTFEETDGFVEELRTRRPLQPWPQDAFDVLDVEWDPTENNPWIPRPHYLRKLARRIVGRK